MQRDFINKRWVTGSLAVILASLVLSSAAGAGAKKQDAKKAKASQPPVIELMWPEPPETPRIKVAEILTNELDLGRKITGRELFMKFLTGAQVAVKQIYQPRDLVVSDDGNRIYASDFGTQAIFIFDREQKKVRTYPSERPFGLALDDQENLYVVEQLNKRIQVYDKQGNKIRTITSDKLIRPTDATIDRPRKLLYVADPALKTSPEHTVKVFDLEGKLLRTVGKGKGTCVGCLFFPTYVATDKDGNVYVTSTLNSRVDKFDLQGNYLRTFGARGDGFGMFDKPKGVAIDSFGNIHVADSGWSNVQIFNQKGEVLLFYGGRGNYPGLMKNPTGITIDKDNKIYVADYLNYRIMVYQLVNTTAEDSYITPPPPGDKNAKPQVAKKEDQKDLGRAAAAVPK